MCGPANVKEEEVSQGLIDEKLGGILLQRWKSSATSASARRMGPPPIVTGISPREGPPGTR